MRLLLPLLLCLPSLGSSLALRPPSRSPRCSAVASLTPSPPLTTPTQAAFNWELRVTDLDERTFGLDTRDPSYGVEIIKFERVPLPLGLQLCEENCFGRAGELRSMALVEQAVEGGGVAGNQLDIRPGDALTYVVAPSSVEGADPEAVERVEGLSLDETMEAIAAIAEGRSSLSLTLKRLVPRVPVRVTLLTPEGAKLDSFESLSGSNLRGEIIRRDIPLYDSRTKRFDIPWGTGDCAGDGLCGTCLVELKDASSARCSPRGSEEELLLSGRPARWRLACRCFFGIENQPGGELVVRLRPQSDGDPGEERVIDLRR